MAAPKHERRESKGSSCKDRAGQDRPPVRPSACPTLLWIHVQPRSSRTEIIGWHGDAIKIRLKAPPVDGAANEELIRFLSKAIGVPKQAVQITAGKTARRKRVKIDGVEHGDVMAVLGV